MEAAAHARHLRAEEFRQVADARRRLERVEPQLIRAHVAVGQRRQNERAVAEQVDERAEEARRAVSFYREYYAEKGIFENAVIAGIPELLCALQKEGCSLFVATSKPEPFAVRIIERFSLSPYIVRGFGASLDETRTEKGDVIAYALKEGGIAKESALMVGDRKHDILGAKENGIRSMGVLFGYGSREELTLAGADLIAETPEEVLRIYQKIKGA